MPVHQSIQLKKVGSNIHERLSPCIA